MASLPLEGDCARCAGLCCVALAFDAGEHFALSKAAGEPCPHLSAVDGCAIHAQRSHRGFGGCERYDCYGAGQRVTQELFGGRSWRESPATAQRMFDAFRSLRQVHELRLLLHGAQRLPLTAAEQARRAELAAALTPQRGWCEQSLAAFERGALEDDVRSFLRSLRGSVRRALPLL